MSRDIGSNFAKERDARYLKHLAECEECRATEEFLERIGSDELADGLDGPINDILERKITDAVLERYDSSRQITAGKETDKKRPAWAFAAAAALAVGVSAAVYFSVVDSADKENLAITKPPIVAVKEEARLLEGSRFVLLMGGVKMGDSAAYADRPLSLNAPLRTNGGRAVVELPTGAAVVLEDGTELYVNEPEKNRIEVRLAQGEAFFAVDPGKERKGFSVLTDKGRIEVTGTAFRVLAKGNEVRVDMLEGTVAIFESGGARALYAGFGAFLGDPRVDKNSEEDSAKMFARLREIKNLMPSMYIPYDALDAMSDDKDRNVDSQERRTGSVKHSSAPKPSIRDLIERTREYKRIGDWRSASVAYEDLIAAYPKSNEAAVSRLALGNLYLRNLNAPSRALEFFDEYLKMRGMDSLSNEALWGKAESYRALGQKSNEKAVLEQLIDRFPDGMNAMASKKRLAELADVP